MQGCEESDEAKQSDRQPSDRRERKSKKDVKEKKGGRKAAGFAHSSIIGPLNTFHFTSSHMSTQTAVQMNQKLEVVDGGQ